MLYLLTLGWPWFAAAAALGLAVGFLTATRERNGALQGRWVVLLAVLILAGAGGAASQGVLAGREGLALEVSFLMALAYFLGLPIGGGFKGLMPAPAAAPPRATPVIVRGASPLAEKAQGPGAAPEEKPAVSLEPEAPRAPASAPVAPESLSAPESPGEPASFSEPEAPSVPEAPSEPDAPEEPAAFPAPAGVAEPKTQVVAKKAVESAVRAKASGEAAAKPAPPPGGKSFPGRAPPALAAPRWGGPDDLSRIKGIGPRSVQKLHALGIYHYDQIAAWTADEAHYIGAALSVPGRVERGKWVQQARALAHPDGEAKG